ncbi:lysine-specific demethylase 3A-like isoform X2 [Saccostrea echinata]|uniref:lysine-specific demethylase 3A-like isoform X2 n=1 Tax=Saccostrea echinata TaxID=191078 RepID=UPI002A836F6D|nr:lysine-specific demethylase 3A-like isoform X2 [Saccostrea echinata]
MAFKCREEIVGKRFLSVKSQAKLKLGKISEWEWRSGVVRAVSSRDSSRSDLSVLIEFDESDWEQREWIKIHSVFQVFLVEQTLVWSERLDPESKTTSVEWPALNFRSIVDKVGLSSCRKRPIEFFDDQLLAFVEDKNLHCFQETELLSNPVFEAYPSLNQAVKNWLDYQDGQRILLTTPTVLVGYRLEVYRAEGTTQWYTAVIQSYNHTTKSLSLTDDTVLEEHNEDPALIQMRLIDDGVVDSILRGVEVGIGPRRTRQTNKEQQGNTTRNPTSKQPPANSEKSSSVRNNKVKQKEAKSTDQDSDKEKPKTGKPVTTKDRKRKPVDFSENSSDSTDGTLERRSRSVEKRVKSDDSKEDQPKAATDSSKSKSEHKSVKKDTSSENKISKDKVHPKRSRKTSTSDSPTKQCSKLRPSRHKKDLPVCDSLSSQHEGSQSSPDSRDSVGSSICDNQSSGECPTTQSDETQSDQANTEDNMHFMKQRLLASNTSSEKSPGPINANIDVNRSVTDQIAKLSRAESAGSHSEEEKFISSNKSVSPKSSGSFLSSVSTADVYTHEQDKELRNNNISDHVSGCNSLSNSLNNDELRSSSRASEHSNSGLNEDRRPASRLDDLKTSQKNSPSSSPLIIDKSEPVHPYRDPELMRKNPVHSNIHGMLGSHKKPPYSSVHTPIPSAATPTQSIPSTTTYPSHPIPPNHVIPSLQYPPHHLTAALGAAATLGIHPSLAQMDPSQLAALQHQQLASMQYQLLLSRGGYPSTLTMPQLEHLWQKTYPSIPIPPQYLLPKNREDLLGHLFSKERELIERERLERERMDRIEKERLERDRQLERERQERIERERVERERDKIEREREQAMRERAEKERLEKERLDRERKEREEWKRMEHEREQKKERERILKESADTLAAVDDHFARSLRNKEEREQMLKVIRQQEMEKFYKQSFEHQKVYEQLQKTDIKSEKLPKSEAYKAYPQSSSSSNPVKQEKPNFSLYGYQPFQQLSYISPDQLHLHGLDKKEEKLNMDSSKQSLAHAANMASQMSSAPPPLIKDGHSSVIYDNRYKDGSNSTSPRPAHSHHSHHISSQSPRQPKPAHTPNRHHGSPHQDQSIDLSSSSGLQVSALSAFRSTESKHIGPRTQSPLRVASPHQLNVAVMQQPVNYHRNEGKPRTSPSSKSPVSSNSSNVPYMSAAIAQPPVSLPAGSVDYSCSLIQQGLVPNPIYSQNSVNPAAEHHGNSHSMLTTTQSMAPTSSHNTHSTTGQQGVKRRPNKESSNRKRQKADNGGSNPGVGSGGVPVTTPQILTNPSPYTTTNSQSSVTSTSATTSSAMSMLLSSTSSNPPQGTSGFMDSFKSFVENAVQNAFYQDSDLADGKKVPAPPPPPTQQKPDPSPSLAAEESSLASSNSHSTLMDTISRVANGQINDTDSDTLSAPSPPPHITNPSSQGKAANHPKLKKAWLQRHSDEDKLETKVEPGSPSTENDTEVSPKAEDKLKNCYVNLTNISPKKEPGTKSPVTSSAYKLPNGNIIGKDKDDESTTSASETESQQVSDSSQKRKIATKKQSSNKKSKADSDDNSPPSNTAVKKKAVKKKEPKESKNVKGKDHSEDDKTVNKDNSSNTSVKKEKTREAPKVRATSPEPMEVEQDIKKEKAEKPLDNSASSKIKKPKKQKEQPPKTESSSPPGPTPTVVHPPVVPTSHSQPSGGTSYNKPPVSLLKKTCEPFLQDDSCSEVTPKLMKCRECKMTPTQRSKKLPNIFCRFYAFRRLRYSQRGFLMIDGFSELSDAINEDIDPWLPNIPVMEPRIDIETAKYIVARVGDKFCELVQQEREAKNLAGDEAKIAWKRAVTGVREMCDVCDTTLFNMHWVCHKCGFVVCLDCYKVRLRALQQDSGDEGEESDPYNAAQQEEQRDWLTCSANRQQHEPDKLMLTQIIPGDALWEVGKLIHDMKKKWNVPCKCSCGQSNSKLVQQKNGLNQYVQQAINHLSNNKSKKLINGIAEDHKMYKGKKDSINGNIKYNPNSSSPLNLLADVASMDSETSRDRSESPFGKNIDKFGKSYNPITEPVSPCGGGNNASDGDNEKKNPASCSTLRELLTKTAGKVKSDNNNKKSKPKSSSSTLDDIIQSVVEKQLPRDENSQPVRLMHYIPRMGHSSMLTRDTPILVHNLTETSVLYPDVPHSWLCDGRLLRLHDPKHKGNFKIFQEQWKRGQPVIVSGVDKLLNRSLWHPSSFSKTFGKEKNDVVNTMSGVVIIGHPMSVFWDGFERLRDRLLDDDEEPMLLKLKDWPPGDDFSDLMPNHFDDLMQALPLPEYTHRHGKLNLASRLPDFLVRPDLGPKMYNAYGSAKYPSEGTTNLHLDVSDAVNCMVYVGIPADGPGGKQPHINMAIKAIDDAGCDTMTKKRVRETNEVPGALWHIYDAMDADKIRDFLNKVGKERGEEIEPHHDPIHDQSWYLDVELQSRLYKEYGVLGYTIVQCMGDAVFIPAGAPHQVKNLHSCIKVAEDFVSPEHLNHCFSLTQEFRLLSDTHTNHEDKLQVKNIMYHAVKDALAVLNNAEPEED